MNKKFEQYTLGKESQAPINPIGLPENTQVFLGVGNFLVALRKTINRIVFGIGSRQTIIDAQDGIQTPVLYLTDVTSTTASCRRGELMSVGGELYICSATNEWTVVGTQT